MESNLVYSLFVMGDESKFSSVSVDVTSGQRSVTDIRGFNDWDEVQRVFMWDANNTLFYLIQTNFLASTSDLHNVTLYTVDPVSGLTTAKQIVGLVEEGAVDVPGFAFNYKTNEIIVSVEFAQQDNNTGYRFYSVNPQTAAATLLSTYVSDNDSFAGWFDAISPDGRTLYRWGYQNVFAQLNPGLSVTDISTSTASLTFTGVDIPSGLENYLSLNLVGDEFLSLAPATITGDLRLLKWDLSGGVTSTTPLTNAHNTPFFGPIAEYVNEAQTQYAAIVVSHGVVGALDRWTLFLVDLPSMDVKEVQIDPILLAQADSVAGLGLPI